MNFLDGKRAIVTGSSRGLGRAYARAFAATGARVVVNGTTSELVAETVGEIRASGGEAIGIVESVASFDGASHLVQACIDAFGGVDILVNNAGVTAERMIFNMTEAEFRGPMEVDYFGTFACSRHAARDMRARGWGRIINTGDSSGQFGLLGGTNVAAAKGGIHAMTYTWAIELAPRGITVNCVIPNGYTRLHDPLLRKTVEVAQERGEEGPTFEELVAAAAKPDEITPLVVYLASDEADWISGQVLTMERDRIAVWSHPVEKVQILRRDGFTLDDIRTNFPVAFAGQLDPVGKPVPWLKT